MAMVEAVRKAQRTPAQQMNEMIGPDPHRPGPDRARLIEYGIPVWALIAHLQGLDGDLSQVAHDYEIPEDAVVAALAYYLPHKAAIDTRIAINAAAA
jgi:uncharacterized protein (DUF433 family)